MHAFLTHPIFAFIMIAMLLPYWIAIGFVVWFCLEFMREF